MAVTRLARITAALIMVGFVLLLTASVVMAHGAITLHGAVEDGRERGRMVAELQVDVARMQARADMALGR